MDNKKLLALKSLYASAESAENIKDIEKISLILEKLLPKIDKTNVDQMAIIADIKSIHLRCMLLVDNKLNESKKQLMTYSKHKNRDKAYVKTQMIGQNETPA